MYTKCYYLSSNIWILAIFITITKRELQGRWSGLRGRLETRNDYRRIRRMIWEQIYWVIRVCRLNLERVVVVIVKRSCPEWAQKLLNQWTKGRQLKCIKNPSTKILHLKIIIIIEKKFIPKYMHKFHDSRFQKRTIFLLFYKWTQPQTSLLEI